MKMMIRAAISVSLAIAMAVPAWAACPSPVYEEMLPAVAAGHQVSDFAFGDLGNDGDLDLVTVSTATEDFGVNVHINDEGFLPPFAVAGDQPSNVALADMNNDGRLDIVIIEQRTDEGCNAFGSCASLQVLFADEEGGFAPAGDHRVLSFVKSVRRIIPADFDKNGHMDVLIASVMFAGFDPQLGLFWGGPSGTGLNGTVQPLGTDAAAVGDVAVGDFNNDTFLDIAAAVGKTDSTASSRVLVWRNHKGETGPFHFHAITASGVVHSHDANLRLVTGHFNKDTNLDVAVAMETAKFPNMPPDVNMSGAHLLLGNGTGGGTSALTHGSAWATGPSRYVDLTPGDFDEDNDLDLTLVGTNRVFFSNSGTGALSTVQSPPRLGPGSRIFGFDFDEDGRYDLAFAQGSDVHILLNSCEQRFVSMSLAASPSPSTFGGNVTFTASLTPKPNAPTPSGTVWFAADGNILGSASVNGAGNASITVNDLSIGSHEVTASYSSDNGFTGESSTITHTVNRPPFGAPLNVTATGFAGPNAVVIRWVSTADVSTHEILRRDDAGQWQVVGSTANEQFTDSAVDPTRAYVYTVRSVHATNGTRSANGNLDVATTMNPVRPADKIIRAADTTDVRSLAQSLRRAAGLSPFTFTDATLTGVPVKAVHLTQLRTAIAQARAALGLPAIAYTQPTITPKVTKVKFNDLQELRASFQ
jgi:hypothetical protein